MDLLNRQQRRSRITILEKRLALYGELRTKRKLDDDEIETYVSRGKYPVKCRRKVSWEVML